MANNEKNKLYWLLFSTAYFENRLFSRFETVKKNLMTIITFNCANKREEFTVEWSNFCSRSSQTETCREIQKCYCDEGEK